MRKPTFTVKTSALVVSAVLSTLQPHWVHADERESLEQLKATTTNLIELLVQEGVLSKQKADALIQKAQVDAKNQVAKSAMQEQVQTEVGKALDEKTVRVQYIPQHVKQAMRDEIEKDVMEKLNYKAEERLGLPEWIDKISFHGDIRLRGQADLFDSANAPFNSLNNNITRAMNIENSTEDRYLARARARLAADIQVNDWLSGGLQLVTGGLNTPVTPNQTEGFAQGKYQFSLDRVFLKAQITPWASVKGGRFENPFVYTDILWDPDLAFDGVAATFTPAINNKLGTFTTIGAFPIEEVQSSSVNKASDKWLYSVQSGINWAATDKANVKFAMAYHYFDNVEGQRNSLGQNDYASTAPLFRQRGNNTFNIDSLNGGGPVIGLASKFELVNMLAQVDLLNFDPVHVMFTADYVKNIGFDQKEILRRTGNIYQEETSAYNLKMDIGHTSFTKSYKQVVKPNEWLVTLGYKHIEADAVLDSFNDSDFRLGGTDAKGWYLYGNYAIDKNAWISARYMTADSISGLPYSVDVLLFDLNARF